MTKNPFLNALAAVAYVSLVASIMFYGLKSAPPGPDTIVVPIAMISLFTLSAAVMGYVFLSTPLQLLLAGEKKRAVNLFLQTVLIFAGITALLLAALFVR